MKKLVVLALVLAISGVASATLSINVVATDRDLNKAGLQVNPSDVVTVQVVAANHNADLGLFVGLIGPELADLSGMVNKVNTGAGGILNITGTDGFTEYTTLVFADLAVLVMPGDPPVVMQGVVVDLIKFHCEGPGNVAISIFDPGTATVFDAVTVEQLGVPEPMTIGLLGLGGLFLRRRLA